MTDEPLRRLERGTYEELLARPNPDGLVVITVPPVEAILKQLVERLGRELTVDEIDAELKRAPSIVATSAEVKPMLAARAKGMAYDEKRGGGRFVPVVVPSGQTVTWVPTRPADDTAPTDTEMDPAGFVRSLMQAVYDPTVTGCLSLLENPPGREPSPRLQTLSKWYLGITDSEKANLKSVVELAARDSLFGVLAVLDGVRQIEAGAGAGVLELRYVKNGRSVLLNDPDSEELHGLLDDELQGPES